VSAWTHPDAVRRQTPMSTCGCPSITQTSISVSSGAVDMGCQSSISDEVRPTCKVSIDPGQNRVAPMIRRRADENDRIGIGDRVQPGIPPKLCRALPLLRNLGRTEMYLQAFCCDWIISNTLPIEPQYRRIHPLDGALQGCAVNSPALWFVNFQDLIELTDEQQAAIATGAAAEVVARPSGSAACQHAAVPDRHGGLRRCSSSQPQA
jgi:hypothetical protein